MNDLIETMKGAIDNPEGDEILKFVKCDKRGRVRSVSLIPKGLYHQMLCASAKPRNGQAQ